MSSSTSNRGLLIVGSDYGCGKTVLTAGLAGAMAENGFRVQALKPVEFVQMPGDGFAEPATGGGQTGTVAVSAQITPKITMDQSFINTVTGQFISIDTLVVPSAWEMSALNWNRWYEPCHTLPFACLFESVGQVGTPWQIARSQVLDSVDIADRLNIPVLLTVSNNSNWFDEARLTMAYLSSRQTPVIGWVQINTQDNPTGDNTHAQCLALSQWFALPFLGCLPHSQSISVRAKQQGNLIRLIHENIDIMPIQMAMGLTL